MASFLCYALLTCGALASSATVKQEPLFPLISDNRLATPEAVKFFYNYYTAKSLHNITLYMEYFHPTNATYTDVTLGSEFANRSAIEAGFTPVFAGFQPGSLAYPLQIVGDLNSAIVHSVDTPGLFGPEIRLLTIFDFLDGKLTRVLDVWDGRKNSLVANRGADHYSDDLGLALINTPANPRIKQVATKLNTALAAGNTNATQALFSDDAIFEDATLRTRLEGKLAIGRYLTRSISQLPYGTSTVLRHVAGSGSGGGYEWKASNVDGVYGISLIELDDKNKITRYSTIWDGSRIGDEQIKALTVSALE